MARHRLGGTPTPPSWLQQYAKALCGAIVAAGGAAAAAAAEGGISLAEGCLIAVTFFGTLGGVATVRNVMTTGQLLQQPVYRIAATGGRKMLGRRAPKHAPALMLGDFLTAVPAHPITDLAPNLSWPMDHNDEAGDCVVAGLDHALQVICAQLGVPRSSWSDAELLGFYRTQNPSFRSWGDGGSSRDNGMDVQTFLEYLVKQKLILGFAKVDHTNVEQMKAAAYLGLAVVTGEILTSRNMSEQVWDYHPGDPDEGGHCTVNVGYDPRERQVSWGALYAMTDAFLRNNVEEAWFIVTQAHVDHPGFRAGFDLQGFAAAYTAITGRPFPAAVTPPVDPPQPQPAGGLVLDPPAAVLDALALKASHSKTWTTPQAWAEHALEQAVKK